MALTPDTPIAISSPLGPPVVAKTTKNTKFANLVFPFCAPPKSFHFLCITPLAETQICLKQDFLVSLSTLMICQASSSTLCCCGWLPLMSHVSEGVDWKYKLLLYCNKSNQAHMDAMNMIYLMKSQKCISRLF